MQRRWSDEVVSGTTRTTADNNDDDGYKEYIQMNKQTNMRFT
jgi:hypothetical protein